MFANAFKLKNELLIIAICTLFSSVTPMILIGAIYSFEFIIYGFLFSVYSFLLFEVTITIGRYMDKLFAGRKGFYVLTVLLFGVLPFILLFIRSESVNDFIALFYINSVSPLFNLPVIMLLFVLLTILLYYKSRDILFSKLIVTMSYLVPFSLHIY